MLDEKDRKPAVPRLDGIDVLRGLSILAVILLHILIRFAGQHVRLGWDWLPYTRHFVFLNGGNGVTTFFAVSGFLITLTSLRRFGSLDAIRPRTFYRIRFARIMPLLLLMLLVLSALHLLRVEGYVINAKFFTLRVLCWRPSLFISTGSRPRATRTFPPVGRCSGRCPSKRCSISFFP
ncbi:MAG TPA: acyltransferase family protein [Acidobacteriaceae bacterium]|nr:acyltransferase family protein [Acidobacteriaceae bacterium]